MKRAITLAVSALMLVSIFAGCGNNSGSSTTAENTSKPAETTQAETTQAASKITGKITFATQRTDKADTTLKDLTKEFMDIYPGTEVEIDSMKDPGSILKVKMASGELDDVSLVPGGVNEKNIQDYFAPIDDLGFTKDNLYYYDTCLGKDGKLYKLVSSVSFTGMVYNKKVFKDCGIESTPKTMDELYDACEKIKAKGIVPIASNFKDKWPLEAYAYFGYMLTGDSAYYVKLSDSDTLIGDNGLLNALKILKTFKDKGYLEKDLMSTSWDSFRKDFPAGKFGMTFIASWYPPQFVELGGKAEDVGMFPFPDTKYILLGGDWQYGIAKTSKNIDTAKAFLKFAFEKGRLQEKVGALSPIVGTKYSLDCVNELMSSGLPTVMAIRDFYDSAVYNKMAVNINDIAQEYMLSKTPDDVVKKYNQKWAEARKALN